MSAEIIEFDDIFIEDNPNIIGRCDACSKVIRTGDMHLDSIEMLFCEEHACMLSDVVEQHEDFVKRDDLLEGYGTQEEQFDAMCSYKADLLNNGDRKFTTIA